MESEIKAFFFLNFYEVSQIATMKYQTECFLASQLVIFLKEKKRKAKFHIIRERNFTKDY